MRSTVHPRPIPVRTEQAGAFDANARWRDRFVVNITAGERAGRIVVGAAAALAGLLLLASAGSIVAVVLELLLVAAGLDLVVTGALGHCPLYKRLGYTPPSLQRLT